MTFASVYDPVKVGQLYEPDLQRSYQVGAADFLQPASTDRRRVLALLIDIQNDFVFPAPNGRLPVPHAVDDTRRTVEWLYRNTQAISHIVASLDTHMPFQIFYPPWWRSAQGKMPDPYTVITAEQVRQGVWTPALEPEWSGHYLSDLETRGKKQLMIWPFHCMEGTAGRALVPALAEAIQYHSGARMDQPHYLVKGTIARTEFYSAIEPEVKDDAHPDGKRNTDFLEALSIYDLIYVAGQARSHCVLETMNSILNYFGQRSEVISKLRFLNDCTSSIPGFEAATERRIQEFAAQGVRLVTAADPIE